MDVNNRHLEALLNNTDYAFKQLLANPQCSELQNAYDEAKQALDFYLTHMRDDLKKRYKDF